MMSTRLELECFSIKYDQKIMVQKKRFKQVPLIPVIFRDPYCCKAIQVI